MTNAQEPKGFDRSKEQARGMLNDKSKLSKLINKAINILKRNPGNLRGFIEEIKTLIRLSKAFVNGQYTEISTRSIVLIIAGLIYLVNPFDVVPDILLGIGFLDDATVLGFVILKTKSEIQRFLDWEATQDS